MHHIPVAFHFLVHFHFGRTTALDARFQEVTGLGAEVTTEELREGGLNEYAHRLPTGAKYNNLVLKRGYVYLSEVAEWCRKAVEDFQFEPQDLTVMLLNELHAPVAAWSFLGCWPVKWAVSDFKAQDNALAIESMELAYSGFRKVDPRAGLPGL